MSAAETGAGKEEIAEKAKTLAWLTAVTVPVLWITAWLGTMGHAGLGGIVLLMVFIPVSLIALVLLRTIMFPVYKIILDKSSNSILRIALIAILAIFGLAFCWHFYSIGIAPHKSVRETVKEIPKMELYFSQNKADFEAQRLETDNPEYFYIPYPEKYEMHFSVGFYYRASGSESTGYKNSFLYTYALDDFWYIEIYKEPAI